MQHFGRLSTVFQAPGLEQPEVLRGQRVANLSGKRTDSLNVEAGLDILGGVIQALGGSSLGVKTAYKSARSMTFEFSDVYEDSVSLADLDLYISAVTDPPKGLAARRLAEEGSLYAIIAALSAKSLLVSAKIDNHIEAAVSAPAIHGLAAVDLGVSDGVEKTWTVSYESKDQPLRFALKSVQLFPLGDGSFTLSKLGKASLQALPDPRAEVSLFVAGDDADELLELPVEDPHDA